MSKPPVNARAQLFAPISTRAEHPAILFDGCSWSYGALGVAARSWAQTLTDAGIQSGDRVAALGPSGPAVVAAMLGTYAIGGVWVPINPRYEAPEVAHVVRDCGAATVLVDPQLADRLVHNPQVRRHPLLALEPTPTPARPSPLHGLTTPSDDATALLIYTSGTTGPSKGVALSYGAVVSAMGALTELWQWSDRDVLSLQLPLFHVHGLCIGVHGALLHGMTLRLSARFSPAQVVADVSHGASVFMGVPTMYARLLAHLADHPEDRGPLRRARLFTAGSAALAASDLRSFEAYTGHRILERYGMSESLITLSNPLRGERRAGSVGLPIPGVTIRVVDEQGAEVSAGVAGELQVQGPGMMTGYHGQPKATAAAFDGAWLRTGDLVVRATDDYVEIVGRLSVDIIKTGGFKVATREIEDALSTHPAVAEIAVFGVADPMWGERVVAAVVVVADLALRTEADVLALLVQHCRSALADFKRPREVLLVDALPRNAMGKVLKVALRKQAEAGYAARDRR